MNRFKRHAMALIVAKDRQTSARLLQESCSRAVFTHAALAEESGQTDLATALQNDRYRAMVAQQEMKRVLIVDPHDICVRLFERAFTTLLPHVEIVGVASAQQAMGQLACQKFDVILVEERLQTTFHLQKRQQSGSDFFRSIGSIASKTLCIGVSAHLPKDRAALEASDVDLCWHKPPPTMSVDLRNDLLRRLLIKRGHDEFARELFGKS
jgi:CheY-like chemotaxis protein